MNRLEKNRNNRQKGFTLVELLLYLAIFSMVMTGMISYVMSVSMARSKNEVIESGQANIRYALSPIRENIRACDAVVTPSDGVSSNQLVLDMPGTTANITFSVVSGRLVMSQTGYSDIYLTDNRLQVTSLVFTNTASVSKRDNINIQLSVASKVTDGVGFNYAETYHTSVTRRK
jgi:prepilin-type N-terminal cleavage/methylation domain-containing protein